MQQTPTKSTPKLTYAAVVTSPAKPKNRTPSPDATKLAIRIPAMGRLIQAKVIPIPSDAKVASDTKVISGEPQDTPQREPSPSLTPQTDTKEVATVQPVSTEKEQSDDETPATIKKKAKKAKAKARKALQIEEKAEPQTETKTAGTDGTQNTIPEETLLPVANPQINSTVPPNPLPDARAVSPPRFTTAEKGKSKATPFTLKFSKKSTLEDDAPTNPNKRKAVESPPKPSAKKNTNEANPPYSTPKRLTIIRTSGNDPSHEDLPPSPPNAYPPPLAGGHVSEDWITGSDIVDKSSPPSDTLAKPQARRIPIIAPIPIRPQPNVKDLERALERHLVNVQAYTGSQKQFNEDTMQLQERIIAASSTGHVTTDLPMQVDEGPFSIPSPRLSSQYSSGHQPRSPQTPTPSAYGSYYQNPPPSAHTYNTRGIPHLFTNRHARPLAQVSPRDNRDDHPEYIPHASPMSFDSDNLSMIESESWASRSYPSEALNYSNAQNQGPNITHLHHPHLPHHDQGEPLNHRNQRFPSTISPPPHHTQNANPHHDNLPEPKETWVPSDVPGVVINGVGLQRTATPLAGWHRPEFRIDPLHGLSEMSRAEVARAPPHSVWILPFRANNRLLDKLRMADVIRELLDLLITIPRRGGRIGVHFMEAAPDAKQDSRFEYPYFILITGITPPQSELLLKYFCISTQNTTIWTFPLNIPKTHFAGTIAGLHYTEDDLEEVRDIIINQLLNNDHASLDHFVTSNSYPFNESAYRSLIINLRISYILINHNRNVTHRAWNLRLPPNNLNNQDTIAFLTLLNEVKIKTEGVGTGYFLKLNEIPIVLTTTSKDGWPPNHPLPPQPHNPTAGPKSTKARATTKQTVELVEAEGTDEATPGLAAPTAEAA
ncbi:hypothetical protein H0H93_014075 [Arthromyces matolae]|nr:hypothetical protein H0H93_014075 [Arthromyces matolae]